MKDISKLSVQEVCSYIACMNKLVEEKIVIFKPNKAFIKFNYDKATRHLEKQNIEQKEEIERLNNIINKLERYINEEYIYDELGMKIFDASTLQDKLQELKGVDKE